MGLNKKINKQIGKMPKYKIQQEAFDNLNLAKANAFGRDRDVQMQEENIDSDVADAVGQAKDVTSSSSALLSTLAMLESGAGNAKRGLAQDESAIRRGNRQDLYAANNAMVDEKDKAWNHNVFAPWEAKLQALREKKARRSALTNSIVGGALGGLGSLATGFMTGGGGGGTPTGPGPVVE